MDSWTPLTLVNSVDSWTLVNSVDSLGLSWTLLDSLGLLDSCGLVDSGGLWWTPELKRLFSHYNQILKQVNEVLKDWMVP